jgi:hypothetical protein
MPRKKASELARSQGGCNEMSASVASRMTRNRLRATFDTVLRMLLDPRAPRRDALGRDIHQVWCDAILANPSVEFARVAREILVPELPENTNSNTVVTNIQSLYLKAVMAANAQPDPQVADSIDLGATPDAGKAAATEW